MGQVPARSLLPLRGRKEKKVEAVRSLWDGVYVASEAPVLEVRQREFDIPNAVAILSAPGLNL